MPLANTTFTTVSMADCVAHVSCWHQYREDMAIYIFEAYKAVNGIKPRWIDFSAMSTTQLESVADDLSNEIGRERRENEEKLAWLWLVWHHPHGRLFIEDEDLEYINLCQSPPVTCAEDILAKVTVSSEMIWCAIDFITGHIRDYSASANPSTARLFEAARQRLRSHNDNEHPGRR